MLKVKIPILVTYIEKEKRSVVCKKVCDLLKHTRFANFDGKTVIEV